MVQSKAATVAEYLESLPEDHRKGISAVRKVIKKNLPKGYVECMAWGMIGYVIPLKRYPDTYNGQPLSIAALGAQKNYMALYLMCTYGNKEVGDWFRERYKASGKKLDMGKACVRFKKLEDLPLDLVGETIARVSVEKYIEFYEKARKK
ncbi:MAG: DUF1801 domain-containing protein [Candidatus Zixiibacteriota bacterium]